MSGSGSSAVVPTMRNAVQVNEEQEKTGNETSMAHNDHNDRSDHSEVMQFLMKTVDLLETEASAVVKAFGPRSVSDLSQLNDQNMLNQVVAAVPLAILPAQRLRKAVRKLEALVEAAEYTEFYVNARLPEDVLKVEYKLDDYIEASSSGIEAARPWLNFLKELQEPTLRQLFASIIAPSGTGKSQLAATAALQYSEATTIYLNFAGTLEASQRFYLPHISEGSKYFRRSLNEFRKKLTDVSAASVKGWSDRKDDGMCAFVHMLDRLLFEEPAATRALDLKLSSLKEKVKSQQEQKPFLVFLDEVPEKEGDHFEDVLCLRDTFRFLGIAPILMSTHTGAQNFMGQVSRGSLDPWVWAISRLPTYAPPPKESMLGDMLRVSERPLVLSIALRNEGKDLPTIVSAIRESLQTSKSPAWKYSPALQLVQYFCTDITLIKTGFQVAHNLVGHHFGSLDQPNISRPCGAQSYSDGEAADFGETLAVAPVSAEYEPLLFLALVTWNESMLESNDKPYFPLVDRNGFALTVMGAFNKSPNVFVPRVSTASATSEKADGNLMEVLVHAAFSLASLKTDEEDEEDEENEHFLPGVSLDKFLPLVRFLLVEDMFTEIPEVPALFQNIRFEWPLVPAMSGSNSELPQKIGSIRRGYLERPPDEKRVDGTIAHIKADGNSDDPFMSIECKNYTDGVDATLLGSVFTRIEPGIRCCCIFVSKFKTDIFSKSNLADVKKKSFHSKINHDAITVLVWEKDSTEPRFLSVGSQDFRAVDKTETDLLVVIFTIGLITPGPWGCNRKRKWSPPCTNMPSKKTE